MKEFRSFFKEGAKPKKHCQKCNSPIFSKGLCRTHWGYEYQKKKLEKVKPLLDADEKFFAEIWKERLHICERCNEALISPPKKWNFHHVLLKSKRPDLRYEKDNVILLCLTCHSNEHT